ncbi:hypothetical protein STEG23_010884 [Scotinomys teguina]
MGWMDGSIDRWMDGYKDLQLNAAMSSISESRLQAVKTHAPILFWNPVWFQMNKEIEKKNIKRRNKHVYRLGKRDLRTGLVTNVSENKKVESLQNSKEVLKTEMREGFGPKKYENLIFDKDAKTVKWKKECIFNKWCWHNWMATCRRLQIDPYLSPCTKLKSKWIKDLNINPVTLNLIEEKVGSTLERIGTGDQFLNITPTAQTLSATINQWDYMKLRSFCKAKDTITKTKRQPTEWEKIFTNPTSDRGLISRIYKELKKHDIKTPNSPIEKWAIELNRIYSRRISNGGKTLKEMLNILPHQRNANKV